MLRRAWSESLMCETTAVGPSFLVRQQSVARQRPQREGCQDRGHEIRWRGWTGESKLRQLLRSFVLDHAVGLSSLKVFSVHHQHVNRTESAVRLTHLPTGITVSMQDTRSQHKNRVKAFQVLRSRLLALQISEQQATSRAERRAQVKGTDRSEKIRTYNFAQDRVTDHRLPLTLNGVQGFLEGDDGSLELMMEELEKWTQRQQIDEMLDDK